MCSNVITLSDQNQIACGTCNDCIAARKNDWVARAMAEKATSAQTLVLHLTYRNNPDGTIPAQARVFHYSDIIRFNKAIRESYFREYGKRGEIRYLVAGELGKQRGRVHWHLILFSERPLDHLGAIETRSGRNLEKLEVDLMQHWSMWPHGHIKPQVPNEGGIKYVMKYILKDQFNEVKSRGTMRYSKSEQYGSSKFQMSKTPAIGETFLKQRLARWAELGAVPPALRLTIPEYSGYWWPKRVMRDRLLQGLHLVNKRIRQETGRDAPQWNTLLASVWSEETKINKDWETLTYGNQKEEVQDFDPEPWIRHLATSQDARARANAATETRRKCGGITVCKKCWRGKNRLERAEIKSWLTAQKANHEVERNAPDINRWFREKNKINPYCTLKEAPDRQSSFLA